MHQKAKRLEDESASMRQAYARKIANTELKCEDLLRQKEDSCNEWFKERKQDILKMQAACAIMHALFQKKRRRIQQLAEDERAMHSRQQQGSEETIRQLKAEREETVRRLTQEFDEKSRDYETRIEDLERANGILEERTENLEGQLGESQAQVRRGQEEIERQRSDIEDLHRRLVMAERTEELARRNAQIESLQEELKKVRKQMMDKRHAEVEALQSELMDYVKFIVHILPEDWRSHLGRVNAEGLHPEHLEERVAALPQGPGRRSGIASEQEASAPLRMLPPVNGVGTPGGASRQRHTRTGDGMLGPPPPPHPPPETQRRPRPSPPSSSR